MNDIRVVIAIVFMAASIGAAHGTTEPVQSTRTQAAAKSDRTKTPMERCISNWDRATQMSKREWRETCRRTVKEYPDLFNKAY